MDDNEIAEVLEKYPIYEPQPEIPQVNDQDHAHEIPVIENNDFDNDNEDEVESEDKDYVDSEEEDTTLEVEVSDEENEDERPKEPHILRF